MGYSNTWHRDYAAEAIQRHERNFAERADWFFAKFVVTGGQGARLARQVGESIGDARIVAIADTVLDIIAAPGRSRRTVTDKQAAVLAEVLLEKFGSARGIGAEIWGLSDAEIEGADA